MLENGDLQEALDTAAAIGDDRLQRQSQGRRFPQHMFHARILLVARARTAE